MYHSLSEGRSVRKFFGSELWHSRLGVQHCCNLRLAIFCAETSAEVDTTVREIAWHHRQRKQRATDRELVSAFKGHCTAAVRAAAARLDSHHGSASGLTMATRGDIKARGKPSTSSGKGYWKCFGCQYMVPCGETYCNGCGHQPPPSISCPSRVQPAGKGNGKGKRAKSTAERQLQAAATAGKVQAAADKELAKKLTSVQAELKKTLARAELAEAEVGKAKATPVVESTAGDAMDQDGTTLAGALAEARAKLKKFEELPEDMHYAIAGGYDAHMASLRTAVKEAEDAALHAKPLKLQLQRAEQWQERASKRTEGAKKLLVEHQEQLDELSKKVEAQREAVAKREAEDAEAKAKVASLAALFAAERNAAPTASPDIGGKQEFDSPGDGWVPRAEAAKHWEDQQAQIVSLHAQLNKALEDTEDDDASVAGSEPEPARKERRTAQRAKRKQALDAFHTGLQGVQKPLLKGKM